ncbi:MAG: type I-U CRISPR-associated protein Csx17 [Opitutales bacterium]
MNQIPLPGCTPEPLMGYLKALGVFRLVSEQADCNARAAWRNGQLVLQTNLSREELVRFFLEQYVPTPIVVPWSGNDFFDAKPAAKPKKFKKTPTGSLIIEAFLQNKSARISVYREALQASIEALKVVGIAKKEQMKDKPKAAFLAHLRTLAINHLDDWIDTACALPGDDLKLNTLLGSGGGSDGNTHFSDNFMQNLWDSLSDFNNQKEVKDESILEEGARQSEELLLNALFDEPTTALKIGRTSSLYHSGAVGGPNAGQGFERKAFANSWNFILTMEGCIAFAGSVSRKLGGSAAHAVFPFQTRATPTTADSLGEKESSGQELWLPLWHRACRYSELKTLLSEGRSEWNGKPSERGVDFAKAVASLGVDRGIDSFARYGIVKGRVGGDNYNTAAFLGRFEVQSQINVNLLHEADPWIERYRRACGEKSPARFGTALRRIDSTVFDYCRFGGAEHFQAILIALGQAERELATGAKFRESGWLHPLRSLSSDWVEAANDQSAEFEIAVALAGIHGVKGHPLGLRANMEPVVLNKKGGLDWHEGSTAVVWKRSNLATNLAAALERRVLDWRRLNLDALPVISSRSVRPEIIAAFIHRDLDDDKIERLLWGLVCCKIERKPERKGESESIPDYVPLPRCYPLLKATFSGLHKDTPTPPELNRQQLDVLEKLPIIKPDVRLLQLLRAGRTPEATTLAAQRSRNVGLSPARIDWTIETKSFDSTRLAAALLLPISPWQFVHLWKGVERHQKAFEEIRS